MTLITCANCQSNNPDNAQVCQNCGQPLTTGSDIQEVSPPWLLNLLNKYGVSQGVLVGTADVFIAPGGTETEFDDDRPDDISDVLQDIAQDSPRPQTGRLASSVDWGPAGEAQSAPDDPVDDVLSGFQPEVAEPVEDYNAEDWLSELAASTSPKPSDEPGFTPPTLPGDEATNEFSDTPDWLSELSRASEAPHPAEISSAQPAAPDQSKLEIPDWLRDSDDFEAPTPPAAESDFPAGRSGQSSSVEDDSPDWMSELGDSE
jgi:hypothetical protein